jgi:hypothetical protein
MTRIGRVKTWGTREIGNLCFQTIIENGHVWLGTWRAVALEPAKGEYIAQPNWESRRTVFERVS